MASLQGDLEIWFLTEVVLQRGHGWFRESLRGSGDSSDDADHGGGRMADEDAWLDVELLKNGEKVVGVAIEGGVALEVEVFRVVGSGAHVVVQNDAVVMDKVGDEVFPDRLIGAEAVGQD
ncbi:hypothetical protein ACFX2I_037641 [Malus domestica]